MSGRKQILVEGAPVSYEITGQGPALMLVHGFGEDGGIWRHQVAALKNHYRLIVPDLPGSGQSPHNDIVMTIESMARVLRLLLEAEEVDRVVMLGHSMGGYITLAFAEAFPEMLSGWGLVHSTAFADSPEKKEARRKGMDFIEEYGPAAFLKQSIPNLFTPGYVQQHRAEVDGLITAGSAFQGRTLLQYYKAMMDRPDRAGILQSSPSPVLFVIGEKDLAVPFGDSLRQSHLPGISYIHVLKQSAHMGMWEEAGKMNAIFKQFLQHN